MNTKESAGREGRTDKADVLEVKAENVSGALEMDPRGFFVIYIDKKRGEIVVEHYDNVLNEKQVIVTGFLRHIIRGRDAKAIGNKILAMGLVSSIQHALYLGGELHKVEHALKNGLEYTQDKEH